MGNILNQEIDTGLITQTRLLVLSKSLFCVFSSVYVVMSQVHPRRICGVMVEGPKVDMSHTFYWTVFVVD